MTLNVSNLSPLARSMKASSAFKIDQEPVLG